MSRPHAQLRIGAAREKQKDYPAAVKAYETAADRYQNQPVIVADALYREGISYAKEAATAEYDQNTAAQAIAAFTDFITLLPRRPARVRRRKGSSPRSSPSRCRAISKSRNFTRTARNGTGAVIYYNEVLQLDPNSRYAALARQRIEALKPRLQVSAD